MPVEAKGYLEYLDKEMTIMGILSAVSIAAPAGVLNVVLGGQTGLQGFLWLTGRHFIVLGSVLCVLAALYFYKQRSLLAWYYGQISLSDALEQEPRASAEVRELIEGADSWETWWPYSWGFTFLVAGFSAYLFAFFFFLVPPHWSFVSNHPHNLHVIGLCLIIVVAAVVAAVQRCVLTNDAYKYREEPWRDFRKHLKHLFRPRFPHDKVYTRLECTQNSGVGVFAIKDIPKDTYIFEPDDDELKPINVADIHKNFSLGHPIRKLYEDFCVLQGKVYQCPVSFNRLTPSWFLNHSESPNVAADPSLKFYALREIKDGEELTADYRAYSENSVDFDSPTPR